MRSVRVGRVTMIGLTLAMSLIIVAIAPSSVRAVDGLDFLIWQRVVAGVSFIGAIADGTSNTIMWDEAVGLKPDTQYSVAASTRTCRRELQTSNTMLQVSFQSNGEGARFLHYQSAPQLDLGAIKSVRLMQGSGQIACAQARAYSAAPTAPAGLGPIYMFTFNIFDMPGFHGLSFSRVGRGDDRLTLVAHGFARSKKYRVVGAGVDCPAQLSTANVLFSRSVIASGKGTVSLRLRSQNFGNTAPRSMQIFRGQERIDCGESIALTTGSAT